ncbi:hypothetical protein J4E91_001739 [Alternaria rosae]|nr:hypothetical protein J4E91_001739 [Alternaria rosae]
MAVEPEQSHLSFLANPTGDPAIDADLQYIRDLDWAKTAVGLISSWPRELLLLIHIAMISPQPQLFLLGSNSTVLYNTAYGRLLYDHHPLYQGRPISLNTALIQQLPEVDALSEYANKKSGFKSDQHIPFFFSRNGRLEEVFLSIITTGLPPSLGGFHATTYNVTRDVLDSRRERSLDKFRNACETASDLDMLWPAILKGISNGDGDISFAALYRIETNQASVNETGPSNNQANSLAFALSGTIGSFPTALLSTIEPSMDEAWVKSFFRSVDSRSPVLLQGENGTLPKEMCEASTSRCYGDICHQAVILPSVSNRTTDVRAVLIVGLAPRTPYDRHYQAWINTLHRDFSHEVISMANIEARSRTEKIRRESIAIGNDIFAKEEALKQQELARAAALEQLHLSESRLQEAVEAKRQQENAVMHCADSIAHSLSEVRLLLNQCEKRSTPDNDSSRTTDDLRDLNSSIGDAVDTIMACTMHQKRIIDDILSLSKLDSNLLEICPTVFHVKTFLNQVESTFRAEAVQAGVQLVAVADPSLSELGVDWIDADPGRVTQVLFNMIANAIKFTKDRPDERAVTVRIGVAAWPPTAIFDGLIKAVQKSEPTDQPVLEIEPSDGSVFLWFKVEDTGCGMDESTKARVFSQFTQNIPKTYSKYGGSGLGLSISKKLVGLLGGEIGFQSQQHIGSTFAFYAKASRALQPRPSLSTRSSEKSITIEGSTSPLPHAMGTAADVPPTIQSSILLVEDNMGYIVYTADNGQEAFDFIKTTQHWKGSTSSQPRIDEPCIDVILMDIEMPIVNGLECAAMIRAAQEDGSIDKHLHIIAVTANARPEQLKRARETGMDDAVPKPFRMSFNLDALFHDSDDLRPKTLKLSLSVPKASVVEPAGGLWQENAVDEEQEAKDGEEARLRAVVASLSQESDYWKAQAEERGKTIEDLDRKAAKITTGPDVTTDTVRRVNRLESEVTRLRSENTQLKDTLKTIEYENFNLGNQNDGKTRKLKGANKKVKNAKEVAGKEEGKAKDAQGDKQRHLVSERRMKKERGDALAALQQQRKLNGDLRAELEVEQSDAPHIHDAAADLNNTTAVILIQFDIRRTDWHQMHLTERFEEWYKDWKKASTGEVRKVVGSEGVDDEKKKLEKLYGDMIEMPDGYMETAAEHDGWCPKRAV